MATLIQRVLLGTPASGAIATITHIHVTDKSLLSLVTGVTVIKFDQQKQLLYKSPADTSPLGVATSLLFDHKTLINNSFIKFTY